MGALAQYEPFATLLACLHELVLAAREPASRVGDGVGAPECLRAVRLREDLGRDSIHFKNVPKIITKIVTKNVMKNLSKSYNKKFKKSVLDTYLLFKLDFRDDFRDNFRDIFKCIELHPWSVSRLLARCTSATASE